VCSSDLAVKIGGVGNNFQLAVVGVVLDGRAYHDRGGGHADGGSDV